MSQMLILDGGVLVNLAVSGHLVAILNAYPLPCAASRAVVAEQVPIPISGQPDHVTSLGASLTALGSRMSVLDPETPIVGAGADGVITAADAEQFLAWTSFVPDATAHLLVHADREQHHLACDDRCVRTAVQALAPTLTLLATEDLLWQWHVSAHPSTDQLYEALSAIETRGSYLPAGDLPAATWWRQVTQAVRRAAPNT